MYVNFKNGIFTQTEKTKKKKSGAKNLFHAAHFRKEKIVCEFYKRNTLRYYFDAAKVVLETGYTQFWRLPGKCSIHIFLPVCVIYMCFFEANERKNQEQSTYQHYQHRNSFIFFWQSVYADTVSFSFHEAMTKMASGNIQTNVSTTTAFMYLEWTEHTL